MSAFDHGRRMAEKLSMIPALRPILVALLGVWIAAPSPAAATCTLGRPGVAERAVLGGTMPATTLYRPTRQDRSAPMPLVILLHGSGGSGAAMLRDSRLAEAADRHGFLVAAPDGGIVHDHGYVWNIPGVATVSGRVPGPDDRDDVAYLLAMIDSLADQGCVDAARVYVTGLSGGGRMTSWLGCVAAARIAAIAPVVGLRAGRPDANDPSRPDPATCRPSRPMPVMAFAGDRDTTNPIAGGGAPYWRYSMHAAEARWAQINHCTAAPTTRWLTATEYEERYAGCRDEADVTGRIKVGAGHSWVADNEAMWAFFARHWRRSMARQG